MERIAPLLLALACVVRPTAPEPLRSARDTSETATAGEETVATILEAVRAFDDTGWWPGFDVGRTPIAIFDGERTYLVGHPATPSGFRDNGRFKVYEGRYPGIVANSAMEVEGTLTAGVILDADDLADPTAAALLLVHESFHVFQRTHHPQWTANEALLFELRYDDAEALAERILELDALRRALSATESEERRRWVAAALHARMRRFALSGPSAAEYERASELNEGLAHYVEWRASGRKLLALPPEDFAADGLRARSYVSGAALAILLDQLDAGWKQRVDAPLDEMLRRVVPPTTRDPFLPHERETARRLADTKVDAFRRHIVEERDAFEQRVGARIVIEADPLHPLRATGFDPLNVLVLGPGDVLHGRYVELSGAGTQVQVIDVAARTRAAGSHPLFSGVRRLELRGLKNLTITQEGSTRTFTAHGVRIVVHDATVTTTRGDILIAL